MSEVEQSTMTPEEGYQKHASSLRALSRAMDSRSEKLAAWAADKNPRTLEEFSKADAEYNAAVQQELRLREQLAGAVHRFRVYGPESFSRSAR